MAAMPPRTDPKELEAERFAGQIVEALEQARREGLFGVLVVAAPPRFLGLLRERMTPSLRGCVGATATLDGVRMRIEELQSSLAEALATARDVALERRGWPWAEPPRR